MPNVDLIYKIAAVGVLVAILHTVLSKAGKEEYGQIVTIAGVAIVFLMVVELLNRLFQTVKTLFNL